MYRTPLFSVAQPHSIHPGASPNLRMTMIVTMMKRIIKNVMKIMAMMTRRTIIIIMMLVQVSLFKSRTCPGTHLHTSHLVAFISEVYTEQ